MKAGLQGRRGWASAYSGPRSARWKCKAHINLPCLSYREVWLRFRSMSARPCFDTVLLGSVSCPLNSQLAWGCAPQMLPGRASACRACAVQAAFLHRPQAPGWRFMTCKVPLHGARKNNLCCYGRLAVGPFSAPMCLCVIKGQQLDDPSADGCSPIFTTQCTLKYSVLGQSRLMKWLCHCIEL